MGRGSHGAPPALLVQDAGVHYRDVASSALEFAGTPISIGSLGDSAAAPDRRTAALLASCPKRSTQASRTRTRWLRVALRVAVLGGTGGHVLAERNVLKVIRL